MPNPSRIIDNLHDLVAKLLRFFDAPPDYLPLLTIDQLADLTDLAAYFPHLTFPLRCAIAYEVARRAQTPTYISLVRRRFLAHPTRDPHARLPTIGQLRRLTAIWRRLREANLTFDDFPNLYPSHFFLAASHSIADTFLSDLQVANENNWSTSKFHTYLDRRRIERCIARRRKQSGQTPPSDKSH